ncbi:MAG TPA: hypothetical protein VJT10_07310 [Steroidobacteraceae bacterium]|nr:hypothetical protein [Steroidobacteraceae bacterium]
MNAALAGPSLAADTPIDVLVARSVMQVRVVQIPRAMVAVVVAVIALDYALRGHVDPAAWHLWALPMVASSVPRTALSSAIMGVLLPHWILTGDMLGASLSGLETAQTLSRQFGFGKVCLITGNTAPARLAELRSSRFPVIVKPAKPEQIFAVIAAAGVAAGS